MQQEEDFLSKWQSQVKKGLLEYIILLILRRKPYYGYELIQDVRQHTELELAEGTVYPLLNRLKSEGLVTANWVEMETGIPRKYYEITDRGGEYLARMKEYWLHLNFGIQKLSL